MERVHLLINRLAEQVQQQASTDHLLITAQMLVIELQQQHLQVANSKVSVTMPLVNSQVYVPAIETNASLELPQPIETDDFIVEEEMVAKEKDKAFKQPHFFADPFDNLPTLAQQAAKKPMAINDAVAAEAENNNSKWKDHTVEVAALLEKSPIKDFKKAININDRYLFINELFRGDEAMYERSLKAIQGFTILPEATFWIQRELKAKLGWVEGSHAVVLFDQLVERRFA